MCGDWYWCCGCVGQSWRMVTLKRSGDASPTHTTALTLWKASSIQFGTYYCRTSKTCLQPARPYWPPSHHCRCHATRTFVLTLPLLYPLFHIVLCAITIKHCLPMEHLWAQINIHISHFLILSLTYVLYVLPKSLTNGSRCDNPLGNKLRGFGSKTGMSVGMAII